ncbi:NAD(P)H-dependent oxidoreductase [Metapseudomonas lalkuanensis]|uniref:NAD(P)H-dependent oxidoreductase n=1 Tax=Metapseudomonas lalkuanensis TaxID=2604832 RepID=UPI001CF5975F|nr:NAD(P)H-dependent oxidoreductase [Pseudomonas lalkuanensis]UCP00740.1 NAD(P)H-dependent oxidoreductase [Pseudomonas lalkuanensis]
MHALIVVAHPDSNSLTHNLAKQVAEGLKSAGHSSELADLHAEGFDQRYSLADLNVHRHMATPPADVLAEQARIERADSLVLVFPVYWWSLPGLLKSWVERVFSNGWAFGYSLEGGLQKKLRHLQVHLIGVAAGDAGLFQRHGYDLAMKTQIDHGIFDYCGASVQGSHLMFESESRDPAPHLDDARSISQAMFAKASAHKSTEVV